MNAVSWEFFLVAASIYNGSRILKSEIEKNLYDELDMNNESKSGEKAEIKESRWVMISFAEWAMNVSKLIMLGSVLIFLLSIIMNFLLN